MTSTCAPIISTHFSFYALQYCTYISLFNPDHGDNTFLQNLSTYQNTQHTVPTPNNKKYIQGYSNQCSLWYHLFVAAYSNVLNYVWTLDKQNREDTSRVVSFSYSGYLAVFMNSKQIVRVPSHTTTFCYSGMTCDGTTRICFKCVGQANCGFIVTLIILDVRENNTMQTELHTKFI